LGLINGKEPKAGQLRAKFAASDSTLTPDDLSELMNDFIKATEAGNHVDLGWPNSTYVVSKVGLSALSRIQQREFNKDSRKVRPNPGSAG
jgi:carbonyl reductase 1